MSETLDVWLNGRHVATLTEVGLALGASMEYTESAIVHYGEGAIVLSASLPVTRGPIPAVRTQFFLDGLLPEASVRAALANKARVAESDTFGLLRAFGLDCAGAVQIIDPTADPTVRRPHTRWLTIDELEEAVKSLPSAPLGIDIEDGVRSSLGGLQGKLAVVVDGERTGVPVDGAPSTHILKPARLNESGGEDWPGIVAAECFGLRLVAACSAQGAQVTAAECRPLHTLSRAALLVTRFDRVQGPDTMIERIHQEDAAQSLAIAEKYQYNVAQPPSLLEIDALLTRTATNPTGARRSLLEMVTLNAALGNCDFHARNLSVVITEREVKLAPAYDVVPTSVWKRHSRDLALFINKKTAIDDITWVDLLDEAESWGYRRRAAERVVHDTLQRAEASLPLVRQQAHEEGWDHAILDVVEQQTRERLLVLDRPTVV